VTTQTTSIFRPSTRPRIVRPLCFALVALILALAIVAAVPSLRWAAFRKAGWLLVVQTPLPKSADMIVIATDAEDPGALTAADLVHSGVAPRVALFPDSDPWEREYARRGVAFQNVEVRTSHYLQEMGVTNVERVPMPVVGSESEGVVLPAWFDQRQFHSVIVITTPDHSRRLSRILRRSMKGRHTIVTVQSTPYSSFDPDRWWQTRAGTRTEIEEFEKLLLDVVRHPLS
jgi:hypothetical protein